VVLLLKVNQSIGIFDSGIGGLTVAKELVESLPNESIIYFGDTVHLPYGDKSVHAVQGYTKKIVDFLLARDIKLILIACNTISAAAYEMLQDYVGPRVLLVDVIDPVVGFLNKNYTNKHVGLIGTRLTVESSVYHNRLHKLQTSIDLRALATPLLVPIIEEGFFAHKLMDVALSEYLSNLQLKDIEALVLGCTHYPVVKNKISDFYQGKVDIIDTPKVVAARVKSVLEDRALLSQTSAKRNFYVSDYTKNFVRMAKMFFGEEVKIEELDIFRRP
jgi:glutamate racemase